MDNANKPLPDEKVGLFFGSFNPIHTGHLIVAQFMVSFTEIDRVCFVVSPQNPFKMAEELAPAEHRLKMVRMAIEDNPALFFSDIEFRLPLPSYSITTLDRLSSNYPDTHFSLILGSDNLPELGKWKEYERLVKSYKIYVYRRPGHDNAGYEEHPGMHFMDAPSLYISSTHIRNCLEKGKSIRYLVPREVVGYIRAENLYS